MLFVVAFFHSESVELSSMLRVLCAGVKVLYKEIMERGDLVTLESIHSKLWAHSEFHTTMFASDSPAKGMF